MTTRTAPPSPPAKRKVAPPSTKSRTKTRRRRPLAPAERLRRPSASARPRRGTAATTRERLVAVAAEVFNRDGYFGTDSNALARAAGYAPATFYKHFPDKRAALLAAYERWVSTEWSHIATALRPTHARQGRRGDSSKVRSTARSKDARPAADARASHLARKLTTWIVAHHRRWRRLRASVLALVGTDTAVRDFYVAQRRHQLALLRGLRAGRTARSGAREADALLLFTFERTCDAIAGGEATALGLRHEELRALLVRALAGQLRDAIPRPPGAGATSRHGVGTGRASASVRIRRPSGRRESRPSRP